ncbi:MAG TPA: hypothetical protein VKJ65_07415 [Phycisphaerae bacterium]|nr:hypothetical protein [Phycisphaerae bacterium]
MLILNILSCRKATLLATKKEQIGLTFLESFQLKVHVLVCTGCRAASRQIQIIEQAARLAAERLFGPSISDEFKLPEQAREKIRTALHDAVE